MRCQNIDLSVEKAEGKVTYRMLDSVYRVTE